MCRLLVERKNTGLEYYKMAVIDEIIKKIGQNSMKKCHFLPLSNHEWQIMGPQQVFYSYLVSKMIW